MDTIETMRALRTTTALLTLGLIVAGCPQPPPGGEPPDGGVGGAGGGGPDGGGGVGVSSGPVWEFDLGIMHPRVTQEEVAAGDHVKVTGEVKGECTGHLRVDAIERQDAPGTPEGGAPPLTVIDLEAVGPFSILVPAGKAMALGGCCDNDRDGLIVPGVDSFIAPVAIDLDKGADNIVLMLGPVQAPGQDAGAAASGGAGVAGAAGTAGAEGTGAAGISGNAPVPPQPPPPDGGTASDGSGPHPDKRGGSTKHPDKRGGSGG